MEYCSPVAMQCLISLDYTDWAVSLFAAHLFCSWGLHILSSISLIFWRSGPLLYVTHPLPLISIIVPGYIVKKAKLLIQWPGGKLRADLVLQEGGLCIISKQAREGGALSIKSGIWTMFRLRGFRKIWRFRIVRCHNAVHCIRVSF